jgi:predicted patatin/cPLA2 family phospholipase
MLQATMRASAALPILAGRPVVLDGHRYLDAGLSEAVPFLTPAAQGATHVLILRSRRLGQISSDGMAGRLIAAWLGRYSPAARQAFLDRHRRAVDLDRRLARAAGSAACPAAVVVRPGPDTPDVSRLESDPAVISAAMAAGRRAMLDVLGTEDPAVRNAALSLLCMPGQTVPLAEVRWCMRTRRGPSIRSVPDPYS